MTIVITDPNMLAQLAAVPGFAEICDTSGRLIGTFFIEGNPIPPTSMPALLPTTNIEETRNEEVYKEPVRERSKEPGAGVSLTELWKRRHDEQTSTP